MNTLAILRGASGNFRPLSLTTPACVNLLYKLTTDYFERALYQTLNVFASFAQNRPPVNLKRASSCHHDVVNRLV